MELNAKQFRHEAAIRHAEAIKTLPKDQFKVKWLLDIEKMTIEKVAELLKITIDSVRVKKAKADHAIREFLKNKIDQIQ